MTGDAHRAVFGRLYARGSFAEEPCSGRNFGDVSTEENRRPERGTVRYVAKGGGWMRHGTRIYRQGKRRFVRTLLQRGEN